TTVRLHFDFARGTMAVQEAHGRVTLARADDERVDRDAESDRAGVDAWSAARERLNRAFEPSLGASPFAPIQSEGGEDIERYSAQPLGDGISIVALITPHEQGPRVSGHGSIYFFPSGMTEHAVLQLSRDEGRTVYSVEIHPLTGRGRVYNFAYEPEIIEDGVDQEDLSEVEDSL